MRWVGIMWGQWDLSELSWACRANGIYLGLVGLMEIVGLIWGLWDLVGIHRNIMDLQDVRDMQEL